MWNWYIGYCDGAYEARAWRDIPQRRIRAAGALRECITERGKSIDTVVTRMVARVNNSKPPGENEYSHIDENKVSAQLAIREQSQMHNTGS